MVIQLIIITFAILSLSEPIGADPERLEDAAMPDRVHLEKHNVEIDHEAILGSKDLNDEFSKLSANEAKKKLRHLLKRMDINKDSIISMEELSFWIQKSYRSLDEEESIAKLKEVDKDGDGFVTWKEYSISVFGQDPSKFQDIASDSSPDIHTFLQMVKDDEEKFALADRNHDNRLDRKEYAAFLYPANYEFMHAHEINRVITDYDKNSDGQIDFAEYMGPTKPAPDQQQVDKANFDSYDVNSDGRLDRQEIHVWVLPTRKSTADKEAEYLLRESDLNGDNRATFEEVLERHQLWVGSAATRYGQHIVHDEL